MPQKLAPTTFMLLDLQNEMVDPKGASGSGGLAKAVAERENMLPLFGTVSDTKAFLAEA